MPEEQIQGIERPPFWAARSPDLNMIEPCWGYLKDMLAAKDWTNSSSQEAIQKAKALITSEIHERGYFLFAQRQLYSFSERCEAVLSHYGDNNFKA